jgi:Ca-activated chloride channel family protein
MSMDDVVARFGLVGSAGEQVALEGVALEGRVVGGLAEVTIVQRYRNGEGKAIEAIYTFPAPTDASVTGFSMEVAGKLLEGKVLEREEAFARYDDALVAGHGAALLDQERGNIFTASVGNLLPGEETIIRVTYVQKLAAEEGAFRLKIPTLVAPRYIPGGAPLAAATGHGTANPNVRVADADRISPPIGTPGYALSLALRWQGNLTVTSPSHALTTRKFAGRGASGIEVTFAAGEVPLDRDVVLLGEPIDGAELDTFDSVAIEQVGDEAFVAISLIPELGGRAAHATNVVFLLDRSGSMGGDAMTEARRALKLCLRHLRGEDRFAILAFDDRVDAFSKEMENFSQHSLTRADHFLAGVDARGGTELLEPLEQAVRLAGRGGHVVVLTDGQVGNEDEIARRVLPAAAKDDVSIHAFAIGLNVSDELLSRLARKTGGALCQIFPGERIDDKVVAVFARATAPRVHDVAVTFEGVEVEDVAPATLPSYVDGEAFSLLGRLPKGGGKSGAMIVRGRLGNRSYTKRIAIDFDGTTASERAETPIATFWAKERIRDLEEQALEGRRADAMKKRIIELATKYRLSSKYTSFVVVEVRDRDRRVTEAAATRAVPVYAAATGADGAGVDRESLRAVRARGGSGGGMSPKKAAMPMVARSMAAPMAAPMPQAPGGMPPAPPAASRPARPAPQPVASASFGSRAEAPVEVGPPSLATPPPGNSLAVANGRAPAEKERSKGLLSKISNFLSPIFADEAAAPEPITGAPAPLGGASVSSYEAEGASVLERLDGSWFDDQRASGLFGADTGDAALYATRDALRATLAAGMTTAHPIYGAQVKRAIEAVLALLADATIATPLTEALAALALLLADGRLTVKSTRAAVDALPSAGAAKTADDAALRVLATA